MHSHSVRGSKLQRERDQRRALLKNLANSLILDEAVTTTMPKAKMLMPYVEKLVTKAKKNTIHSRRQIISAVTTVEAANRLQDEIAPMLTSRNSGHLRLVKEAPRRGDNAPMGTVEFVDSLVKKEAKKPAAKVDTKKSEKKSTKIKSAVKKKEAK